MAAGGTRSTPACPSWITCWPSRRAWAFDLDIQAKGDLHIDPHHTVEDVALTLGSAFQQALGRPGRDRAHGLGRLPMDESLAWVAVDFSGRPYCVIQAEWHAPVLAGCRFRSSRTSWKVLPFRRAATCTCAVRYGRDDHHQAEAIFKALAAPCAPPRASTRAGPARFLPVKGSC